MFPVLENLRAFFNSRPPLVVFMICLASFAIALITLAFIVKTKDIPDSDVIEDWNTFLEKFSKIDLCFSQNRSFELAFFNTSFRDNDNLPTGTLSPAEIYQTLQEKFREIDFQQAFAQHKLMTREVRRGKQDLSSQKTPAVTDDGKSLLATTKLVSTTQSGDIPYMNASFTMNVEVVLAKNRGPQIPWSETHFVSVITGDMLKLKGKLRTAELLATFIFSGNLSSKNCQSWHQGTCEKHLLLACVQLHGPKAMFPKTQMPALSDMCQTRQKTAPNITLMEPSLIGARRSKPICIQGSRMSTYFSFEESLTVLLSLHDRSVINLRLMRTSYFLFVMVLTFLLYGMIKGRRTKNKVSHNHVQYTEKVPT